VYVGCPSTTHMCTWAEDNFPRTHTTVAKTTRVHPPISGKNKKQELTPHEFVILQDVCSLEREGA
jgi:hypothetical protein